jgi:DNA-directed RNA polymerase beta subunit
MSAQCPSYSAHYVPTRSTLHSTLYNMHTHYIHTIYICCYVCTHCSYCTLHVRDALFTVYSIYTRYYTLSYSTCTPLLQILPHVGTEESAETGKGFFLAYVVHKLLMCSLDRLDQDDRDHYGKKRLDLAGPLVAGLFRTLFRALTKVRTAALHCTAMYST